jgi:signal transduction histidine kinase
MALAGRADSARLEIGDGVLVAAVPLVVSGRTVGALAAEQGLDDLLRSRYRNFADFTVASLALIGASALALLLFAARLAWRIRRLEREAGAAIDARGRQVSARLQADAESGDELGELSRTISALLTRLQRHGRFVESLPRTLRHELGNPLNSVATALQNLAEEPDDATRERLLERAGRGLARLEQTLAALTEAADLEEALQGDPRVRLDLAALLRGYLESFVMANPEIHLSSALPGHPAWIEGVDYRLEQLLDKLLDNAVDFTPAAGVIEVTLDNDAGGWRLEVANDGPPLPETLLDRLFEAPASGRREHERDGYHLGLGLYVVRRIAEAHGGRVAAANLPDDRGARFSVWLPASG